jgi:hypothetical protein
MDALWTLRGAPSPKPARKFHTRMVSPLGLIAALRSTRLPKGEPRVDSGPNTMRLGASAAQADAPTLRNATVIELTMSHTCRVEIADLTRTPNLHPAKA